MIVYSDLSHCGKRNKSYFLMWSSVKLRDSSTFASVVSGGPKDVGSVVSGGPKDVGLYPTIVVFFLFLLFILIF